MCTAFRDGFQSVYGARVFTPDFLPAIAAAKDAGIDYFEAGGGARFQSLYFYCNEDAFAMTDAFREVAGPDANLQTLSRGVNVVGLESQPSDIVKLHADLFKKHGISTIRNFDALNDVDNLIYSGQCIVDAGLKHQVCVTLMELPPGCTGAHDSAFYIDTLRQILDAGIPYDSVCFKDASGTAVPSKVYETISEARAMLPEDTFIHFHTHETAGIGVATNLAALDAGADAIDLSMAPCSGGTCQPDIIVMWHALRGSDYDLDIDIDKVRDAEEVFKECMADYFLPPEAVAVEPMIPWSPMPGGALTANTQMLRDNGIMDKYPDMIKAMGEVVEKGGFGTSVTPVSQFYFQQAFNNVMFGTWERIAESYGQMVLGYFGKTPVAPDAEVMKIASEQLGLEPTTQKPLERNDADPTKGVEAARKQLLQANLADSDENIFIVATCKDKGLAFLKGEAEVGVRKIEKKEEAAPAEGPARYTVTVNGKSYNLAIDGDTATVDGKPYQVSLGEATAEGAAALPALKDGGGTPVKAQMPGKVIRLLAQAGDHIEAGDGILVLEAMKMEMPVTAPAAGTITDISVGAGEQVANGQVLAHIG
ncbi:MAG TPA: biotin attachment protein [Candidatus Handelsmanbacteria bacterium]|nr:biotin attachment protein [Candidatus Handelsmanbacteria bacterium]